jgi:ParB-like chromosome segregation protein Spo0J
MSEVTGKFHPVCLAFPEMVEAEHRALVADIRDYGQRHPLIVDDNGVILDGRHRYRACKELGLEPSLKVFTGTEAEKVALIVSENIHRRHLTTEQRAAIAAELT